MIASLRGPLLDKRLNHVIIEASGIGYEVSVTAATAAALPNVGQETLLFISESFGMYGGGQTLYGFLSASEKAMFETFRDEIPATGAKKALEYLDKASKSLPDFRRAILEKDARLLTGVFGFTRKTADRLVDALKDKFEAVPAGAEKIRKAPESASTSALAQALHGLSALGYKPAEARAALAAVSEETSGQALDAEKILRLALKKL